MDAKLSHSVTLALLLWGVIAPLVGILGGHFLTRSSSASGEKTREVQFDATAHPFAAPCRCESRYTDQHRFSSQ